MKVKHIPVIGQKYNLMTIISEKVIKDNSGQRQFHMRCECGKELFVRVKFLFSKRKQIGCNSCSSKQAYKKFVFEGRKSGFIIDHHLGVGDLTKTFYSYIKRGAYKRNINFSNDITIEYLWNLFLFQNKKCKLSGQDINLSIIRKNSNINWDYMTASLDRINPEIGYEIGNVQWVHKDINRLKWAFTEEKLFEMCELVYKNRMKILSQDLQENNVVDKVQRLDGENLNQ